MKKIKAIGYLKKEYTKLINSTLPNQEIILTEEALNHIKREHLEDYEMYLDKIPEIVNNPDYIGENERHKDSIEFIKVLENNILVAVKLSSNEELYVASMYRINKIKLDKRLYSKSIIPVEKNR